MSVVVGGVVVLFDIINNNGNTMVIMVAIIIDNNRREGGIILLSFITPALAFLLFFSGSDGANESQHPTRHVPARQQYSASTISKK